MDDVYNKTIISIFFCVKRGARLEKVSYANKRKNSPCYEGLDLALFP
jgi:hypothetical protein